MDIIKYILLFLSANRWTMYLLSSLTMVVSVYIKFSTYLNHIHMEL